MLCVCLRGINSVVHRHVAVRIDRLLIHGESVCLYLFSAGLRGPEGATMARFLVIAGLVALGVAASPQGGSAPESGRSASTGRTGTATAGSRTGSPTERPTMPPPQMVTRLRGAGIDPVSSELEKLLAQRLQQARSDYNKQRPSTFRRESGSRSRQPAPARQSGRSTAPGGQVSYGIDYASVDTLYVHAEIWMPLNWYNKHVHGSIDYALEQSACGFLHEGKLSDPLSPNPYAVTAQSSLVGYNDYAPSLPFGNTPRETTLIIKPEGLSQLAKILPLMPGSPQKVVVQLTIDAVAPFLTANDFGFTAENAHFGGDGPRASGKVPWTTTTGEDVLGWGVNLGAGYQVTETRIVAAHSQLDAPGDTSPDNDYRGAIVKLPPTAGRLQTTVAWHYGPGESISYTIEWTLRGANGQRPLLTMPKSGPCDS